MRRASAVALLVGFGLIIVGILTGASPVTVIGALATAGTVATMGLAASRGGSERPAVDETDPAVGAETDEDTRPAKHLEGLNFRLTDSWDIWKN